MVGEGRPFGELFAEPTRNGLTRPKAVRGDGVKMVNMGELFAHPRLRNVQMDRVPLSASESERFLLKEGDLLFARQSLVLEGAGKCSIFLGDDEPVCFESHVTRVRLDRTIADPSFYFYYLQSHHGRTAIRSIVEQGAGASGIRGSDLESLNVLWRPLPEQRAIAYILDTLDDKIELNRRMSETLEAMARALFKSWFVDFDPVRAKMNPPSPPGRGAGGEGSVEGAERLNPPLPAALLAFARQLRGTATDAETLMWRLLRDRRVAGAKFRRQHPFPPYILDFYCHEHRLAIEIDGGHHGEEAHRRRDAQRSEHLAQCGIRVLRFWNNEVLRQTEAVMEAIYQAVSVGGEPSPPTPLPQGEGSGGLPQALADLFPARLVDSDLGEIPEGWEVGTLGDVAEHPRRSVQPDSIKPDTHYVALEHMPKRSVALSDWGLAAGIESNKFEFRKGEILFGKLRPYFHKVGVAPIDGVCSTDIVVLAPKERHSFAFVLGLVSSDQFVESTNAGSTGTKMPRTSWADMARYETVRPPKPIVASFAEMIQPTVERIIAGIHESRALAALRDTLLPKLISGELRVDEAEAFLQARGL